MYELKLNPQKYKMHEYNEYTNKRIHNQNLSAYFEIHK